MKIQISIIFVLAICGCSAMFRIPTSIGALRNQLHDILTGNSQCATNQTQLNADCMLAVFDQMDFPTLLTMAETSHFYSRLCAVSFENRFSDHEIIIENDSQYAIPKFVDDGVGVMKKVLRRLPIVKPTARKYRLEVRDELIIFDSVQMALRTLRIFGNVIRKLKLRLRNADTIESITIIRYVEKYCADSLIELALDVSESNVLEHISKPFKRIEHVLFEDNLPSMKRQTIPFNQMFPALKSLSFKLLKTFLLVPMYQEEVDLVIGLLSAQIRSVSLDLYHPEIFRKLTLMPQLEHFTFYWWDAMGTQFTFENVTIFTTGPDSNPVNLRFPKLQELVMCFHSLLYKSWLEFLNGHRNLKRIHLTYVDWSTDNQFKGLTSMLENLEEMFVYSKVEQSIGADIIIEFIETHKQLKKLHLEQCNDADKEILQSRFSGEWTITNRRNGLSFEREIYE